MNITAMNVKITFQKNNVVLFPFQTYHFFLSVSICLIIFCFRDS